MIRSVHAGGGPKADLFVGAGEPLRIDQSIQLGYLGRPQDIVDHQIALKIEKVLLQLLVRSVHGHTLPCLCCYGRLGPASTLTCLRRRPRKRSAAAPSRLLLFRRKAVETIREERDE